MRALDGLPSVAERGTPEARFWDAEDYHQKYFLRRNRKLVEILEQELGLDWDQHSVATKLNAACSSSLGFDPDEWLTRLSTNAQSAFRAHL